MTWEAFWLPNIIQATVFATLAALVGVLVRRWLKNLEPLLLRILGLQETIAKTTDATSTDATVAATESRRAAESAGAANAAAAGAEDLSRQANESVVWLAEHLAERLAVSETVNEQLKERIDRLLGTRARQLAAEQPRTGTLLVPADAGGDDEPMTITGRHRLHTTALPAQTLEGDPA